MVYHWLLTKPLSKIIEHLTNINPDRPSEHKLPMLRGNEKNELGLWINTANQLLASIERNTHLRREAENSLLRMSQYDFLTGLPNRQQLQQQLEKENANFTDFIHSLIEREVMQDAVTVQQHLEKVKPVRTKVKTVVEVVKRYQKTDPALLLELAKIGK